MSWYKKSQTEDEDLIDSVKETMMDHAQEPLAKTVGVKRYFLKRFPDLAGEHLASIEIMTMVESKSDFAEQSSILAVSEDQSSVFKKLTSMGYVVKMSPVDAVNVYGKKKVSSILNIFAPSGEATAPWKEKFWTKDVKVIGAIAKPLGWGKK